MKITLMLFMILSIANSWSVVPDREVSPGGMGNHPSVQDDSNTNRGTDIMGPKTLGQPAYPSSGPLPKRRPDMTGEGTSSSTYNSSDINPSVPAEKPAPRGPVGKEAQEEGPKKIREEFPIGPYRDEAVKYEEEGPEGEEAQEAAEEDEFEISKPVQKAKQHGE